MKTVPEPQPNDELKQLFRQLFDTQHILERYNINANDSEISSIVETIDVILEKLLDISDE